MLLVQILQAALEDLVEVVLRQRYREPLLLMQEVAEVGRGITRLLVPPVQVAVAQEVLMQMVMRAPRIRVAVAVAQVPLVSVLTQEGTEVQES
jgi:hypothetical protein